MITISQQVVEGAIRAFHDRCDEIIFALLTDAGFDFKYTNWEDNIDEIKLWSTQEGYVVQNVQLSKDSMDSYIKALALFKHSRFIKGYLVELNMKEGKVKHRPLLELEFYNLRDGTDNIH